MKVALLVDAGPAIGYGHVSRSFTLASALARRRIAVALYAPPLPEDWAARLRDAGVSHDALPRDLLDAEAGVRAVADLVERTGAACFVVDHYGVPASVVAELVRLGRRVLRLEDDGRGPFAGEGVLCPLPRAEAAARAPEPGLQLYGPRFALLDASYRRARPRVRRRGRCERVLVSCGGSDPVNLTLKAVSALSSLGRGLDVDVVVGPGYAWRDALIASIGGRSARMRVHDSPRGLVELLLAADLAIGAPGHTSWERACLGVPSVLAIQAGNQVRVGAYLAEQGVARVLGRAEDVDAPAIAAAVEALSADGAALERMSAQAAALVDGSGAERVADALQGLTIRRAVADDARQLHAWANEPATRAQSLSTAPIPWEDHVRWLDGVLRSQTRRLYVGELDGVPVGQCRLDQEDSATVVSVSLDAGRRGQGIARPFLAAVLRGHAGEGALIALVRESNAPSLALFRSLSFQEDGPAQAGVLRLRCPRFAG